MNGETVFRELQRNISKEKKIIQEIEALQKKPKKPLNQGEKTMVDSQMRALKDSFLETGREIVIDLSKLDFSNEKFFSKKEKKGRLFENAKIEKEMEITELEKETLRRFKKEKKKIIKKKEEKPRIYAKISNRFFSEVSRSISEYEIFKTMKRDLVRSNMRVILSTYISMMILTTIISAIIAISIFSFVIIFNIQNSAGTLGARAIELSWIIFAIPLITFILFYFYPTLERKSIETKINRELPFATIHMSAISGSMIDLTRIFEIIIKTEEYPNISREFTKLLNEINIYGYDLISALRTISFNSPSKKFSELLNGISTTITSGGDLPEFFDKRSQTLVFDHKLEREKSIKTATIFMDIYISLAIAAPMILMLLLMMMKISGLGVSLSTSQITTIVVGGVTLINVIFLTFLYLKQGKN